MVMTGYQFDLITIGAGSGDSQELADPAVAPRT